ncbi:MAG: 23S rRNA (pseudouridine(1915)-N(3))-methyltransferase RlmH [Candidatus Omnitrophota bacterium]|nr:23S rRNA (pseudouridine(1915)-N(3))-methyltransferase RlmH [Candidatus Omnitrophota bacterium]
MKTIFNLHWLPSGKSARKAFKLDGAENLIDEYSARISKFSSCAVSGAYPALGKRAGAKVWICTPGPGAKMLTSEKLAEQINELARSGTKTLHVLIGGPDGFSSANIKELKPDLLWSLGPLTLPHELAAVIVSEQIYRAWTILRGMPYHSGH